MSLAFSTEKILNSPYELLSGTENKKSKEYKQMDYIVVDKQSKECALIEMYQNLGADARKRLEGYMNALNDMK